MQYIKYHEHFQMFIWKANYLLVVLNNSSLLLYRKKRRGIARLFNGVEWKQLFTL
jgi:hypothetical protein